MDKFTIIQTFSGDDYFQLFEQVPHILYPENSDRFKLGNDPVSDFLTAYFVILDNGVPVGRYAFYENPNLFFENKKSACIGSYECVEDAKAAKFLLKHAIQFAKEKGYSFLLGPMEGSTWNNYRFSLHNDSPNFFMEPYHHVYYNRQFLASGFKEIAHYLSNIDDNIIYDETLINEFEAKLKEQGASCRMMDMDKLENDLLNIAQLCNENFSDNFLYTPIENEQFAKKYLKLKSLFDPKLVYIVENREGQMEGLSFSINDYNDPSGKTYIIKSLVRRKDTIFKGIGAYLGAKTLQLGIDAGYTKIIHAFMIETNRSVKISEHYHVKKYKSYALYGIKL